ncbi:MAG: hypothetical protein LBL31_07430 [Spirochaetaceae bacterium]|nr:hypothetical protein [Spirochaetaceae bacterium]
MSRTKPSAFPVLFARSAASSRACVKVPSAALFIDEQSEIATVLARA